MLLKPDVKIELNAMVTYSCSHHSKNPKFFDLAYLSNTKHVLKNLDIIIEHTSMGRSVNTLVIHSKLMGGYKSSMNT